MEGIIIGKGGKSKIAKEVNAQGKGKGKLVNEHEKGKMQNAGQEDKLHCPWVLYISKGEKGKWLVNAQGKGKGKLVNEHDKGKSKIENVGQKDKQ